MSISPIQSSFSDMPLMATQPATKKSAAAATTGSTTGTTNNTTDLSSTFLQLLTQELQNQDPTAPMDSTQMVGQMISLNQLEQLATINQTLTKNASAATSGTSATAATQAALQAASMGTALGGTPTAPGSAGVSGL